MPDQKSRSQRMVDRLREMRASSPDIEASAVVSADGLIVASDLPAAAEEERVSAMSAAILSLGERISKELGRGPLDQVFIRGADGFVFLMPAGEEAVLTILARRDAKLGLVMLDSRRTAADIAKMVQVRLFQDSNEHPRLGARFDLGMSRLIRSAGQS